MNLALDIDTLYDAVKDYVTKGEQPRRLAGTEWLLESSLRDKPRRETMIIAASLAISLEEEEEEKKEKGSNRTCRGPAPLTSITLSRDHL